MMQGQVFLKVGGELALSLFNFFKIYHFYIWKILYKVIISCRMQPTSAANVWCFLHMEMTLLYVKMHVQTSACVAKPTSGASCSWWWLCYMLKHTCGQVFVLPSWCLVHPAADDDFVKLLYSLQNCVMNLKKKISLSS